MIIFHLQYFFFSFPFFLFFLLFSFLPSFSLSFPSTHPSFFPSFISSLLVWTHEFLFFKQFIITLLNYFGPVWIPWSWSLSYCDMPHPSTFRGFFVFVCLFLPFLTFCRDRTFQAQLIPTLPKPWNQPFSLHLVMIDIIDQDLGGWCAQCSSSIFVSWSFQQAKIGNIFKYLHVPAYIYKYTHTELKNVPLWFSPVLVASCYVFTTFCTWP